MRYGEKIPALPPNPVFSPALTASMNGIALGAYLACVFFYWRNGRRALPEDDKDLAILVRLTPAQFRKVKSELRSALSEVLPQLERAWEIWESNQASLVRLGQVEISKRRAARLEGTVNSLPPAPARPKRTETQRRIAVEKRQVGAVFVD